MAVRSAFLVNGRDHGGDSGAGDGRVADNGSYPAEHGHFRRTRHPERRRGPQCFRVDSGPYARHTSLSTPGVRPLRRFPFDGSRFGQQINDQCQKRTFLTLAWAGHGAMGISEKTGPITGGYDPYLEPRFCMTVRKIKAGGTEFGRSTNWFQNTVRT